MISSYIIDIPEFKEQFTINPKFIETVKRKADRLGIKYSVEVLN